MAKKKAAKVTAVSDADIPVVGLREPCPCGSGRRYKACHGRHAAAPAANARTFEGFASEGDLVALRELVPSATAPLTLRADAQRKVELVTILPMAWPALVRQDGSVLLALQVNTGTGDVSRDLGAALELALETEPGNAVPPSRDSADAPRLQDLVEIDRPLEITVHDDFAWWIEDEDAGSDTQASLERANQYAHPTVKLTSVPSAYWTQMGEKEHLRWVMPHDEETLLNALARLQAADETSLGEDTRLVGMFRAHGLVVPVWDLPLGFGAAACEPAATAFAARLEAALAETAPLTDAERRARAGLTTRQVTLR